MASKHKHKWQPISAERIPIYNMGESYMSYTDDFSVAMVCMGCKKFKSDTFSEVKRE